VADLRVAIGVLCGTVGGPASYGKRLVAELAERPDVRLTVLTDDAAAFARTPRIDVVALPMRGAFDRLRWQYVALGKALRKVAPDIYHDTKNALPFGVRVPAVVTVHDLAYHTVPDSFGIASRTFLKWATRHAVKNAHAVVVPSQATARDVARFHPAHAHKVHVVPHGIDPAPTIAPPVLAEARTRLRLPAHFVLHVGTVQARKNVDLVVDGVRALRARGFPHHCVLIGRRGWRAERALAAIASDPTVCWHEHLPAADLAAVYALADAFVSPSAYEGFGFAVADALAAGVPALTSDLSSLPELGGDAVMRLRDLTAAAVTDALAAVLGDPARRDALRRAGPRRAAEFSWQDAAAGHLRVWAAIAANATP